MTDTSKEAGNNLTPVVMLSMMFPGFLFFLSGIIFLLLASFVAAQSYTTEEQKVKPEHKIQETDRVKNNRIRDKIAQSLLTPMAPEFVQGMEFPLPKPYTFKKLYEKINHDCPSKDFNCLKSGLMEITKIHGAKASLDLLRQLIDDDYILTYQRHHITHHIGFYNVITFGASSENFALCAQDFENGCVHGFFQGIGRTKQMDPQAARKFSDDLVSDPSIASHLKSSVYHGLGHAHMVYVDYNLLKAIDLCDQLDNAINERSCWGGMFMENEDCSLAGNWQKCGYSKEDPTAPCSQLPSVYQETCYFNHARWLLDFFDNNFIKVIEVCKNIAEGKGCLKYLVILITDPGWQYKYNEIYTLQSIQESATFVCQQFPDDFVNLCIIHTALNFKKRKITREINLEEFCQGFDPQYRQLCFSNIYKKVEE